MVVQGNENVGVLQTRNIYGKKMHGLPETILTAWNPMGSHLFIQ